MKNGNVLHSENNLWEEIFINLSRIQKLSDHYNNEKYNNDDLPLSKLFYEILKLRLDSKEIITKFEQIINQLNINLDILNSSNKLLNFLLYGLHMESKTEIKIEGKNKDIKNDLNNRKEFFEDEKEARNFFNEKNNEYKNCFIKKNFFGIKKIIKCCGGCRKKFYSFNHFKFSPLDIKNINKSVRLNPTNDALFREFEKNMICDFCKKKEEFKIKIEIKEMPKYYIILLYNHQNNVEIKFLDEIFDENYNLLSFIIKKEKSNLDSLFKLFKCSKGNNKKYKSFWVENGKFFSMVKEGRKSYEKEKIPEKPYFIIYKRKSKEPDTDTLHITSDSGSEKRSLFKLSSNKTKDENNNSIKTSKISNIIKGKKNVKESNIISINHNIKINNEVNNTDENIESKDIINNQNKIIIKSVNKVNDKNIIINNKKNIDTTNNKNDVIINNKDIIKNDNQDSIKNNTGVEGIIRLYFKNQTKNEIYFLDIENTKTFEIILNELNDKFCLSDFDKLKLFFNKKEIDKIKSPMNINIPHGSYIYILPTS